MNEIPGITGDMYVAIHEARAAADQENGDFAAKITAAMRATKNHWMVTDQDKQFRSAIGGLLLYYPPDSEEHKRLQHELHQLVQVSAFLNAARAGINVRMPEGFGEGAKPIGLLAKWKELP